MQSADVPCVVLAGLRIFASRDGDRVTGKVDFPYPMHGRSLVPIDYHSHRPSAPSASSADASSLKSQISNPPGAAAPEQCFRLDPKASMRLVLVNRWRTLCADNPRIPRKALAERVAASAPMKCRWRSLQLWSAKLDALGPEGLIDGYIPAPKKVLALTGDLAADAVKVCAWWSFRIGNNPAIDTKMVHSAASLFSEPRPAGSGPLQPTIDNRQSAIPVADVMATIDCYYAWPCDRTRMPFKPYSKWVRYDFEKWLLRAAAENDYRRTIAEQRGQKTAVDPIPAVARPVPLLDPPSLSPCQGETQRGRLLSSLRGCPPSKTRRRDVLDRSTRESLRALGEPRTSVRAALSEPRPSGSGDVAPIERPIALALASLDDSYRVMLLRAAAGDSDARRQAVSTFPLWWDKMPGDDRLRIETATEIPLSARRPGDEGRMMLARVRLFLPLLKRRRAGFHRLGVAAGVI
jgi:hypothetical protein